MRRGSDPLRRPPRTHGTHHPGDAGGAHLVYAPHSLLPGNAARYLPSQPGPCAVLRPVHRHLRGRGMPARRRSSASRTRSPSRIASRPRGVNARIAEIKTKRDHAIAELPAVATRSKPNYDEQVAEHVEPVIKEGQKLERACRNRPASPPRRTSSSAPPAKMLVDEGYDHRGRAHQPGPEDRQATARIGRERTEGQRNSASLKRSRPSGAHAQGRRPNSKWRACATNSRILRLAGTEHPPAR